MSIKDEIRKIKTESSELRKKELSKNYQSLSPKRQNELVTLSRKMIQEEKEAERISEFFEAYYKLNDEGKKIILEYVEALLSDPRYRREIR